ncbi:gibberellin-regulated protein 14-like [Myripristis murdjan]|uniref:gibberellin-regulated protein 14-like n=1 Tax=Myripristis murdjan TaxID=586833 RepID=UPI001175D616|nr:gibberellin-regulated protein 14-like [Myripristis murdjan]
MDEASVLLEKLQTLGHRAVVIVAKPGKKPATWHTQVVHPKWQLTAQAAKCLDRMKALFELLITGWTNQQPSTGSAIQPSTATAIEPSTSVVQPSTATAIEPSTSVVQPSTATAIGPSTSVVQPSTATAIEPWTSVVQPSTATAIGPSTSVVQPSTATAIEPWTSVVQPSTATAIEPSTSVVQPSTATAIDPLTSVVQPPLPSCPPTIKPSTCPGIHPSTTHHGIQPTTSPEHTVAKKNQGLPPKKKPRKDSPGECSHMIGGKDQYYPVKRVVKTKMQKGKQMELVEWEPCSMCGKMWPLQWVAKENTKDDT